jgi:hypothetical protein
MSLFTGAVLLAGIPGASALESAAVPEDGTIRLTDYGCRDWGPERVRYRLDTTQFPPGKLALLDRDGKTVPCQVKDGVLSFVAGLKKGETVAYKLQAGTDRSRENSGLTVAKAGEAIEIANALFAVRVPKPREKTFETPAPAGEVPGPILGVRQQGFEWCGGSRLFTDRKVAAFATRLIEEGPASVLYEARYTFDPAGQYVCRIRVSDGLSYAEVTEEFDFGGMTDGRDFMVFGIGEGWKPGDVRYLDWGKLKSEALAPYVEKKAGEVAKGVANVASGTPPPIPRPGGGELVLLERFTTTGAWGPRGGFGVAADNKRSLTVLPLHAGAWRRAMALTAWQDPARGVVVALPISVRPQRWHIDCTEDQSPFSMQAHDSALPPGYGRRVWALGVGEEDPAGLHLRVGVTGLDRYKDWIVDWPFDAAQGRPENKAKAVYPRAFTTPALAARLRKTLDQHPDKAELSKLYLITGKPESAAASAQDALRLLRNPPNATPWSLWGFHSYRDPDFFMWLVKAEDALAWPDLPAEQRAEIRRRLAIFAHVYSEPDGYPSGSGIHLGTPNMSIGPGLTGIYFAALLPDHPSYAYWMEHYRDFVSYWLARNTTAGGAWFEPPTYQLFGPTRWLSTAQILLRNGGWGDLSTNGLHAAVLTYNAHQTMPDPRFKGWRILPGMGNSGNTLEGIWGHGVGVVEAADPEAAGFFSAMHRLASGNRRVGFGAEDPCYPFYFLPDVPEKLRPLMTTYIPGYGVAFRAHFGSPDETAMLFRCGYNRSHWDLDDQNVILYGKGAPLSPGAAYQYYFGPARQTGTIFNRCRVGGLDLPEPNGRVFTDVQDYGFGPGADYAVGRMYYSGEELGDGKGEMEWRRHILFLKSEHPAGANYFVMRDSFTRSTVSGQAGFEGAPVKAGRKAWWFWLNLDTADKVKVDGAAFDAAKVAVDKLTPAEQMPVLGGRTLEMSTAFGAGAWFWFDTPAKVNLAAVMSFTADVSPNYHHRAFGDEFKKQGVMVVGDKETKTIFRAEGNTDDGFFYVVYPRKEGEGAPACERLAPGCLKIRTPEATDYAFVSDEPLAFEGDGVVFAGKAGAVRVFPDRVVLALNAGSGKVGYKGHVLTGHGPFEKTIAMTDLKPGETDMGGYEKKIVTVDLGRGVSVRGELPFEARLEGDAVKITADGRARQFILTWPDWLRHPQYFLDGQEYLVFVSDYASQDWGRFGRCYDMCLSTRDGKHELEIRPRVWPKPWADGFVGSLTGQAK